ncbi:dimeric dihydrodiol dehydrogenase [Coccidioides immitis RS]|uniref:D-xylose 1-dehydrogenase (NADP(+), D-xylono-1,5-lactone-forming) n=4 Tax=Coccidioides immitis TaxID=5501 RepID=J3KLJ2_COCIM|nr:dimeric dihydrodiol dehydrogenase [Coccidioides immitis RS]KMP10113.1 oxidoreductase [Coccidioides immitis RMSCC 2394]KMU80082.1 oxidoreductase domain containing protein [Coccidioides immitis RMSCC 3703]KMU86625.1 oxidoreductase [Coccidioides immitis H538.4]TPX24827.1 hypothetical protein DIZ76_010271 [Coccidioides immitis]EAS37166.3 dimeric dihydrodiol dehydrogenase [Coccidioides immitis RS]
MAEPYKLRWGMMATGGIVKKFTRDLLIDPALRSSGDISHTVSAVASSTSKARAEQFIAELGLPAPCAAYGSYEELVKDPCVDVVYVATPHSHHFQNAMLALEHGKHVLCEKAFTVNAAQAKILVETARKKELFLMEAVWTRYFPLCVEIRELVKRGEIGEVLRVIADTSAGSDLEKDWSLDHRMVNINLAGGALLDLGIYSLTWAFQILYHTLPPSDRAAPSAISSQITKYPATGADESTSILLEFPRSTPLGKLKSHAVAMTSIRVSIDPDEEGTAGPSVRIQGTNGEIQVYGDPYHPKRYKIIPRKIVGQLVKAVKQVDAVFPGNGRGMYWEADEVARCLRDGKLESETMPLSESLVIMEVMDEVRRQGGLAYPEKIESTQYPLQL